VGEIFFFCLAFEFNRRFLRGSAPRLAYPCSTLLSKPDAPIAYTDSKYGICIVFI